MKYDVVQHRDIPGQWHAEAVRPDGSVEVTIFTGPDAEQRARQFALFMRPMALSQQMNESLSYHRPTFDKTCAIEVLRAAQKVYAGALEALCPPGRALSIAKTEFETSCMWAVKSIVIEAPKA